MAGPVYFADPAEAVRSIELDGLTALFHRPSGMTHILAAPAPQILAALAGAPGDAAAIVARMSAAFEVEAEDAQAAIEARLAELEAAGLVRRA
jgi:PqqD family protein of HPr-rel-A system